VQIGRRDRDLASLVSGLDDPLERMLRLFPRLDVVHETQDLFAVLLQKLSTQRDEPRGVRILDPLAGGAQRHRYGGGVLQPLPPAFAEYRSASRTLRRLARLALRAIGVMSSILDQPISATRTPAIPSSSLHPHLLDQS
jgi:hypothetical protein